jgi:hypothetical protein
MLRATPFLGLSTVALGLASVTFLLFKRGREADLLHPTRVFGSLWCLCLAVASLRILPSISEWSSETWACLLTPVVTFPFGVWIGTRILKRRNPGADIRSRKMDALSLIDVRKNLWIALACLGVGFAVLAYEYHLIGGIPLLSDNPDETRMLLFGVAGQGADPRFNTIWIKLIHPFVEFNKYAVFLAVLLLLRRDGKTRAVSIAALLIASAGILLYLSQAGRSFVVDVTVVVVGLAHYLRRRIRLKQLCAAVLTLALFVGFYGSYRASESSSAPEFRAALAQSDLPPGSLWEGVAFGYATVAVPLRVFDSLVDDFRSTQRPPHGFLFYSFHSLIPRTNIQEFSFDLYGGESVAPTFLAEFYGDFGYPGVLFGTSLLGMVYGWVYALGERKDTAYRIYARCLFLQMLVFFPYVNLFSQYVTWILDLCFMYTLLRLSSQTSTVSARRRWTSLAGTLGTEQSI